MSTQTLIDYVSVFAVLIWSWSEVRVLAMAIFLNFALAVAASLKNGTFTLRELWTWLIRHLLPMTLVYAATKLAMPTLAGPLGIDAAVTGLVWGLLMVSIAARIVSNLAEFGVKLPEVIKRVTGSRDAAVALRSVNNLYAGPGG